MGSHDVPLPRAFALCALAYVLATAAAVLTGVYAPDWHPIAIAAAADVVATVVIFAFSVRYANSSFYDAYWSVAPPLIALYFWWVATDANLARQALATALVFAWGIRLTYNWARGWTGLGHEDWRYVEIREKTGKLYWVVSFLGIHFFPTVQTFAGSLGLYWALGSSRPLGWLDAVAAAVTLTGIGFEAVADEQLRRFVTGPKQPGQVLGTGLWAWSRHPNYFGEMTFWWGVGLFGVAAAPESWRWSLAGPAMITVMFAFVSLPMMEKRQLARKPSYAAHAARTSLVIPWPPRR